MTFGDIGVNTQCNKGKFLEKYFIKKLKASIMNVNQIILLWPESD